MESTSTLRLFIGGISEDVTAADLSARLAQFGELKSSLEIRTKGQNSDHLRFGYADLIISEKNWRKCQSTLSNALFKGGRLVVQIAKPDFKHIIEQRHEQERLDKEASAAAADAARRKRLRRALIRHSKNINELMTDSKVKGRQSAKGWARGFEGRAMAIVRLKLPSYKRTRLYDPRTVQRFTKLWQKPLDRPIDLTVASFDEQRGAWLNGRQHIVDQNSRRAKAEDIVDKKSTYSSSDICSTGPDIDSAAESANSAIDDSTTKDSPHEDGAETQSVENNVQSNHEQVNKFKSLFSFGGQAVDEKSSTFTFFGADEDGDSATDTELPQNYSNEIDVDLNMTALSLRSSEQQLQQDQLQQEANQNKPCFLFPHFDDQSKFRRSVFYIPSEQMMTGEELKNIWRRDRLENTRTYKMLHRKMLRKIRRKKLSKKQ